MTGLSLPAILALAVKVVHKVSTHAPVPTRVSAAVVYIGFTVCSLPAVSTDTLIHIHFINTRPTVTTRAALTVINILVAVGAGESLVTLAAEVSAGVAATAPVWSAHVRGDKPHAACTAVRYHGNRAAVNHLAGRGPAVVFEVGAVFALVIVRTLTEIIVGQVETLRAVLTGASYTVVDIQLAQAS